MQQVQIKKEYVAPKIAELGNISTITYAATPSPGRNSRT